MVRFVLRKHVNGNGFYFFILPALKNCESLVSVTEKEVKEDRNQIQSSQLYQ